MSADEHDYQIDFTIKRDDVEVGFGGVNWSSLEGAMVGVETLIQRREWETAPGMPDPGEVDPQ